MMVCTILLGLFFLLEFNDSVGQTCDQIQYTTINDVRRSTKYKGKPGSLLCDKNFIQDDKWYRFDSAAGNKMPTQNPGTRFCGTYAPIWMRDTHPTTENVVKDATACGAAPFLFPLGCGYSYAIKVIKCGKFFLYRLKEPKLCSLAYCAGDKLPNTQCSVTGETLPVCPGAIPRVTVGADIKHEDSEEIRLRCFWESPGNLTNVEYQARWFGDVDDKNPKVQANFTGLETPEFLFQPRIFGGQLNDKIGYAFHKNVYCTVRARFKTGSWSKWAASKRIYTGMEQIRVINDYNPGTCDEQSHGKEVLVKDRSNDDKILICVKENSAYQWQSVDGSSTLGEFINPAYDCSDVLNHIPQANDGFYWINLKTFTAKKVWCDMTTDKGGFILVGRKTTPKTWTLPSNATPVYIYGSPHWSSSLGDVPIMDFRVQIATSDNLKSTKAHWFYRLKTKRPLKELMVQSNECGWSGAGIADITFVKDLQTDTIVNHNFSCSRFGFGHSLLTGLGWASMNQCLQKPCPWGYARKTNSSLQHDYHGSFSYSAVQEISGMEKGATAFVGCDGNKCCGCFGPIGGTKNYCSRNCDQAINGGTVTNQVFTWFWVRPSLPKILWKKCMDYKIKTDYGKYTWYKLVDGSTVPVRGRCNEKNVNLLDGVAVVPKGKTIPNISAMLAYRNEDKQMYLRSNGTWTALAERDKIIKELPKLVKSSLLNIEDKIINETIKKVEMQVKPKLDQLNKRLDAQNISTSRKLEKIANEIQALKNALTSPKTTPSSSPTPRRAECIPWSKRADSNGYNWLNESSRIKEYITTTVLCDKQLSYGWYRFGGRAGTQIATSCVPIKRCGAHAPGWMKGAHPTEAEGKVSRTVAFHWSGNCQRWTQSIQVINCGAFYVYYLIPTSQCSLRYCGSS